MADGSPEDFPVVSVAKIVRRPFAHPTTVALLLESLRRTPLPVTAYPVHPVFHWIVRPMTAPVLAPALGCFVVPADFAPADFVAVLIAGSLAAVFAARPAAPVAIDSVAGFVVVDFATKIGCSAPAAYFFAAVGFVFVVAAVVSSIPPIFSL